MEPDRAHDDPARLDRPAVRAAGSGLTADSLAAIVAPRLGAARRAHVESVAAAIGVLARSWPPDRRAAAVRAAWLHDAFRSAPVEEAVAAIRSAGEEPDPWALRHVPVLLHAQAAAAWAPGATGESDPQVLLAVRHHPTGHPEWADVGRALYVADFCEPGRAFAGRLGTARMLERAAEDAGSLAAVAREVLVLRLRRAVDDGRPIHPDTVRTWNAWLGRAQ
jgi:HD superfamily phosphohydrolase YqeK